MATNRFKDLLCIVLDVGPDATEHTSSWAEVLRSIIATRMMVEKPHMELSVILFGSDQTENDLATDADVYSGIEVLTAFAPCTRSTYEAVPRRIQPGRGAADAYGALLVAGDLIKRTSMERKLHNARKSIAVISPLAAPIDDVAPEELESVAHSFKDLYLAVNVGVPAWAAVGPGAAAGPEPPHPSVLGVFERLHSHGVAGAIERMPSPWGLCSLARTHTAPFTYQNVLQVDEFQIAVRTAKLNDLNRMPRGKPHKGLTAAPHIAPSATQAVPSAEMTMQVPSGAQKSAHDEPQSGIIVRDQDLHIKGKPHELRTKDDATRFYRFGETYFPAAIADEYAWQAHSEDSGFKGIQVLAFIPDTLTPLADDEEPVEDAEVVPRWALQDAPYLVLPASAKSATAVSALVRALRLRRRAALVRFALVTNASMALGALVPIPAAQEHTPDHFLLFRVPWAQDYKALALPSHQDLIVEPEYAVTDEAADAVAALVWAYHAGAPRLPSDWCGDPFRMRAARGLIDAAIAVGAAARPAPVEEDGAVAAVFGSAGWAADGAVAAAEAEVLRHKEFSALPEAGVAPSGWYEDIENMRGPDGKEEGSGSAAKVEGSHAREGREGSTVAGGPFGAVKSEERDAVD